MSMTSYQELIKAEIGGVLGSSVLHEMNEIIHCYELYEGKHPAVHEGDSAKRSCVHTNFIKKLINDESRYMCARPPEIVIKALHDGDQDKAEVLTDWLNGMLDRNDWGETLLKGVRDALIGKRVALKLSYEEGMGVRLRFAPSLEFVYEPDEINLRRVNKAVFFYSTTPDSETDRSRQRLWKQRYRMENGHCILSEGLYDGYGRSIELTHDEEDTGLDFIPAFVVINGGLSGDLLGESDVLELQGNQKAYDDTKSDDIDALKYQMFGQKVFIDASPESIEHVRIAPNAMIDIQTEPGSAQQAKAQVLEAGFAYGDHLAQTLDRLKDDMHEIISVPRLTPDLLSGLGTSGKALRMLYWNLNCRCEEKWAGGWDGAIRWMAEHAMRMARIYGEELPEIDYTLTIDHLYPVIDDDEEERERDLSEVYAQARSRRSYIAKWQPDDDPDGELRQIQREKRLLEDAFEGAIRSESM